MKRLLLALIILLSLVMALLPITLSNNTASATTVIVTFNATGTVNWTVPANVSTVSVLVVAGGGGGGFSQGGGGGAGGYQYNASYPVTAENNISVTVGTGGAGGTSASVQGANGTNSSFGTIVAIGGGGGASANFPAAVNGQNGGCGGGAAAGANPATGTGGTGSQGGNGGKGYTPVGNGYGLGGGGGGASANGVDATASVMGDGGIGTSNSINGSAVYYAGGGGGGGDARKSASAGLGGNGGGGNGSSAAIGGNGSVNTGGGGGGGGWNTVGFAGGYGGSGIVIVSYDTCVAYLTTASGSGGNVSTPGEGTYPKNCNESVAIIATADTCYRFVNWTGDTATIANVSAASTTINMSITNKSITANFASYTYGFPTSIIYSVDSNSVILAWMKGTNTSSTYIRFKIGSYPTGITDGDIIGNVSGFGYIHTGLSSGTSYYYRLWGVNGSCYSPTNTSIMCTTTAGYTGATTNPQPTTDTSSWGTSPNGSALENNPLYVVGNLEADEIGMPHNTWWFLLGMGFLVVAGIFTFTRTDNLLLAVSVVVVFGGILASVLDIIPIWCIVIFAIYAIFVSWKELR